MHPSESGFTHYYTLHTQHSVWHITNQDWLKERRNGGNFGSRLRALSLSPLLSRGLYAMGSNHRFARFTRFFGGSEGEEARALQTVKACEDIGSAGLPSCCVGAEARRAASLSGLAGETCQTLPLSLPRGPERKGN